MRAQIAGRDRAARRRQHAPAPPRHRARARAAPARCAARSRARAQQALRRRAVRARPRHRGAHRRESLAAAARQLERRAARAVCRARRLVPRGQPAQAAGDRGRQRRVLRRRRASACWWRSPSVRVASASSLVVAERLSRERAPTLGLSVLREHCQTIARWPTWRPSETLALARSLFGDAPNVERFAEWLHGRTAGSPLHCVEISRQLVRAGRDPHEAGIWVLPAARPHVELPEALEDALLDSSGRPRQPRARARAVSEPAAQRADARAVPPAGREQRRASAARRGAERGALLLDELARSDVLLRDAERLSLQQRRPARSAARRAWTSTHARRSHARLGRAFPRWRARPSSRCASRPAGTSSGRRRAARRRHDRRGHARQLQRASAERQPATRSGQPPRLRSRSTSASPLAPTSACRCSPRSRRPATTKTTAGATRTATRRSTCSRTSRACAWRAVALRGSAPGSRCPSRSWSLLCASVLAAQARAPLLLLSSCSCSCSAP